MDLVDAEHDEMDEQARSSQHDQSTSTAEISMPPSDDGEHMNAHEFGNDDGLGLVRSSTPLMVAPDERNIQNSSSLPTFSVSATRCSYVFFCLMLNHCKHFFFGFTSFSLLIIW